MAALGLLVGGLMPLSQAVATSTGAGALLAAICTPNGTRYVEIDLGGAGEDAPQAPLAGSLDHCPGCLGAAASAVLPAAMVWVPPPRYDRFVSVSSDASFADDTIAGYRPRAPPTAS